MALLRKQRLLILVSLLIITPLGFLSKFYRGFAHEWFNDYGGAILYEIFWCLLIFWFIPTKKAVIAIPIVVSYYASKLPIGFPLLPFAFCLLPDLNKQFKSVAAYLLSLAFSKFYNSGILPF